MKNLIKLSIISIIIFGSSIAFGASRKPQPLPTKKPVISKNHVLVKEYSYREGNKVIYVKEYANKQQPSKHRPAPPKRRPKYNSQPRRK